MFTVSCVALCLSPVTCHMSLTPTAKAMNALPANSPMHMHIRMVCKDPKINYFLWGDYRPFLSKNLKF